MTKLFLSLLAFVTSLSITPALHASTEPAAVLCARCAAVIEPAQHTTVVTRMSDAFPDFTYATIAGKLDLTRIVSDPQVTRLNLYQLTREDCFKLGLQTHDWGGKPFADYLSTKTTLSDFIAELKRFPHLKELIFRGQQDKVTTLSTEAVECWGGTITRDAYFSLKESGYKVTLLHEGDAEKYVDWLFERYKFTEEQFYGFMRMASLLKATDDPIRLHPGVNWDHKGPGWLAMRMQEVVYGAKSLGFQLTSTGKLPDEILHRAIAAYTQMTGDALGLEMFLHGSRGDLNNVMGLIRIARPDTCGLLEVIVSVHKQRLYYGDKLYDGERSLYKVILKALTSINHKETPEILKMMRDFIPDFTAEDLKQESTKGIYKPDLEISEVFPGAKQIGLTRRSLFLSLCNALGNFEKLSQLARLKCLFSVLELKHIQATDGLDKLLQDALRYTYDISRRVDPIHIRAFLAAAKASEFNPLLPNSEAFFLKCLEEVFLK